MSVEVACPNCQSKLKAPDGMAGKKARCKRCDTSFRIPGPSSEPPAAKAATSASPFAFGEEEPAPPPEKPKFNAKSKPALPAPKKAMPPPAPPPTPFDDEPVPIPVSFQTEPLPLEDEPAGPAASGDPFAFSTDLAPAPAAVTDKGKLKEKSRPSEKGSAPDHDADARPSYRGAERGNSKILLYTLVFGALALGGGITTVVLVINAKARTAEAKKMQEEAKAAKEAAEKAEAAKAEPSAPAVAVKETPKEHSKTAKGKAAEKTAVAASKTGPTGKNAKGQPPAPPAALALPASAKVILLEAKPTKKLEMGKKPSMRVSLEAPLKAVIRVFPPESNPDQMGVLWRSTESVAGKGGRLTLSRYFEGGPKGKLEVDGDDPLPICDLSPDAERFALAIGNKVTVYDVTENAKVGEGWEPYGRPEFAELRKAGLAALFFGPKAERLATVATTGHIHLWEVKTAKLLGEFVPSLPGPAKSVDARALTLDDKRARVLIAVGGAIHAVAIHEVPAADGGEADKKAKIPALSATTIGPSGAIRPLALAFQGGSDGRLLVAWETVGEKKEKAVMRVRLGAKADTRFFRWPAEAGEPILAAWPSSYVGIIGTDRGTAVLFDDENRFTPVAQVLPPGPMIQAPTRGENQYWVAAPDPADPLKTLLAAIEIPFDGYAVIQEAADPKSAVVGLRPEAK